MLGLSQFSIYASAESVRYELVPPEIVEARLKIYAGDDVAREITLKNMARADSPTKGRDGTSHFGDIYERNMVSPISMLGDLIPVLSGVALGARLQGRNVATLTWIGDGGQSTGVTYEGINFAAVQNLGLVLVVESNLWAYSTPSDMA